MLTLSSFQLFYGKLYSIFSIKTIYLGAIALFEVGSLICATAPNSVALIVGRAIAGLGAAGIFSGGLLITAKIIPLDRRAGYLGIMSAAFGLAAILGPFIGGALTDKATWRWCFGINLPLGAVTIILCCFFIHTPTDESIQPLTFLEKCQQLDLPGTTSMVAALICLLIALQWGGSAYPWSDGRIIALFVVFGVLAAAFIVIQVTTITGKARTIPSTLARNRDVWLAGSYAMCITGGIYVAVLYLPVWFQTVQGYSAFSSGTMITPMIAGYVVCSVVAGGLTVAIGYYNPGMIIGTVLAIAGAALLTTTNLHTSKANIIGYQLLYGFGVGFGFGQPSYVVQTTLPTADIPIGITFITLVQNLSASVFVAIGQSIFQDQLRQRIQAVVPGFDLSTQGHGAADILDVLPPDLREAGRTAYSISLLSTLYIPLALSCASVVGALFIRWGSMKKNGDDAQSSEQVSTSEPQENQKSEGGENHI